MAVSCINNLRPKLPRNKYGNVNGNYTTVSSINYSSSSGSSGGGGSISNVIFTGADASTPGTNGLVPAPSAGSQDSFLKGNASWTRIPAFELIEFADSNNNSLRVNSDVIFSYDSYSYGSVTAYQFKLQDGTIISGGGGDISGLASYTYSAYAYSLDQIYTSAFVSGQLDAYLNAKIDDTYSYFTNVINGLISRIEVLEARS